jgi:cyclic pyranopterin phosphate synthase
VAQDKHGREINYLRISVTDMCNLRCVYCMPEDMAFRPREDLLTDEEILRLAGIFAGLGFRKFRLTGGEPTIREGIVELVKGLADLDACEDCTMTTNGILLKHLARPLAEAGLQRVSISLDTLDQAKFKAISRWGNVDDVMRGIEAAEEAGIKVKINCVVVRGVNDGSDVIDLARLTLERDWQVRYIEVMPFGSVAEFQKSHIVPEEELRATITRELGPLALLDDGKLDGEARMFKVEGAAGKLGFISSVTKPFCAGCNRARLTADGRLRLCLLRDKELDLRSIMRDGAGDAELKTLIANSIWFKPWGHGLADEVFPKRRVMSEIGG